MLKGKKGVIMGVANKRSIAWSIAEKMASEGAVLAFSYQGERLEKNVKKLTRHIKDSIVCSCDVTKDEDISSFFCCLRKRLGSIDFLVHSIAFAEKDDLIREFSDISRKGFALANDISCFSLISSAKEAAKIMPETGGSIITLSYLGGERVVPNYNIMGVAKAALEQSTRYLAYDLGKKGIRVNAISPGPINTLAARGIPDFAKMLSHVKEKSPLRRNTEPAEVADTALFLASDLSRGITGEILYVDCGYHIMGM